VPYPFAVDDHQTANAQYLSDAGAAILMPQQEMTQDSLSIVLEELCGDRNKLIEMSMAARELAKPQATDAVAKICAELAGYDFDKGDFSSEHITGEFVEVTDSDNSEYVDDRDDEELNKVLQTKLGDSANNGADYEAA